MISNAMRLNIAMTMM